MDTGVLQQLTASRLYMLIWSALHAVAVAGLAFSLIGLDKHNFNSNATSMLMAVGLGTGATQFAHLAVTAFGLSGMLRAPRTTADAERALQRLATFWTGSAIITVATSVLFTAFGLITVVGP
jgi:hypothetical protein